MSDNSKTFEYEWYETPYGKFRIEKRRFGTWSSFGEDGTSIVTGGTRESVVEGTPFHLEGVATNWANCRYTDTYDGGVGGKL
tara:strand:- start:352 stop:597 length:246 start_codon:yes stop_codon:yes gene_type:complete